MIAFGFWDIALLVLVSSQATLLAYVRHPKWKALIMVLPIPFTLASLAVGAPVNTTHVAALNLLLAYTHAVRVFHDHLRLPIILAIVLATAGYCVAGALLRDVLPLTDAAFWVTCVLTLLVAAAAHALYPKPDESGSRTHLPVYLKFPIVAGVILMLIVMKRFLQGFMTMFPMVGVVASYEVADEPRDNLPRSAGFHVRHGPHARRRAARPAELRAGRGTRRGLAGFPSDAGPSFQGFLDGEGSLTADFGYAKNLIGIDQGKYKGSFVKTSISV